MQGKHTLPTETKRQKSNEYKHYLQSMQNDPINKPLDRMINISPVIEDQTY